MGGWARFALLMVSSSALLLGACSTNDFAVSGESPNDSSVDGTTADDGVFETTPPPDSAPDSPIDGGTGFGCLGKADGTPCGDGSPKRICFKLACVIARCGDGWVDTAAGEECDDRNLVPSDGCEPVTCKFTCHTAADCDDKNPCTVGEACGSAHVCTPGTAAPKGTECELKTGGKGSCNGVLCAPASCGNGITEAGEDCDDKNLDDTDGCRSDCKFTCKVDGDCSDKNLCNGVETCDTSSHKCMVGMPLSCDDSDVCTDDSCLPATGCSHVKIDVDGDGFGPGKACGGDCNDGDPKINPGQKEICNGIDDNCNGFIDEGVTITCYKDGDGDGHGDPASPKDLCVCGSGYVTSKDDCYDGNNKVYPGEPTYYTTPYTNGSSTSWDYNCNGLNDEEVTGNGKCSLSATLCSKTPGWQTTSPGTTVDVPCGGKGVYIYDCDLTCAPKVGERIQGCR